jgi:hypothetical protein
LCALFDESVVEELEEQSLNGRLVGLGVCLRIQVEGDSELTEGSSDLFMLLVREPSRRNSRRLRGDRDRRTVLIRPGDHQYVVARQTVVSGDDVCREIAPGEMSEVAGA